MTIVASWIVPLAGPVLPSGFVFVVAVAAAWAWQTARLRARERDLELLTGQRIRALDSPAWALAATRLENADDDAGWKGEAGGEEPPGNAIEAGRTEVLVVGSPAVLPAVKGALEGAAGVVALADSAWSARVACRDAFDAGRPYNLVLLDTSLADLDGRPVVRQLEEDLHEWGARLVMIRPRSSGSEEGVPCHEDPDRRGRDGFAAAARGDAAALGLRGDCRH